MPAIASEAYQHDFSRFYNSPTLSDFTINYGKNGGKTFFGHRVVMCSKSPYFAALCTGQWSESLSREITLKEDDPAALEAMFEWCYLSKCSAFDTAGPTIDEDGRELTEAKLGLRRRGYICLIMEIAIVADKYRVEDLFYSCLEGISPLISQSCHTEELFDYTLCLYGPGFEDYSFFESLRKLMQSAWALHITKALFIEPTTAGETFALFNEIWELVDTCPSLKGGLPTDSLTLQKSGETTCCSFLNHPWLANVTVNLHTDRAGSYAWFDMQKFHLPGSLWEL